MIFDQSSGQMICMYNYRAFYGNCSLDLQSTLECRDIRRITETKRFRLKQEMNAVKVMVGLNLLVNVQQTNTIRKNVRNG